MGQSSAKWVKDDVSIEFKNGEMIPFTEGKTITNITDVMYFYYDIEITHLVKGESKILTFSTHDYPKVKDLGNSIDYLMEFNMENNGYLIEDLEQDGFHRKVFYTQVEINDLFWIEYFIRLERYDYEVKQSYETTHKKHSQYKMTIGQIDSSSKSETGGAVYFNCLEKEDLLRLRDTANKFISKTIKNNYEAGERNIE